MYVDHREVLDRLRDTFASVLEDAVEEGVPHEAIRQEVQEELALQLQDDALLPS
jgi:hypothetical protein